MNLRFVIRDGKKILQYCKEIPTYEKVPCDFQSNLLIEVMAGHIYEWVDIPLCDEFTGQEIRE
jgi:hypothetical protein